MYFTTLQAALAMDGHGAFVWSAYGICLLVVTLILVLPLRRKRRFLRQLAGELRRREGSPIVIDEGD